MMRRLVRILLILAGALMLSACREEPTEEYNPAQILAEEYHVLAYVLNGDGISFDEAFQYVELSEIDQEVIKADETYEYGCIIILDREGNCELTNDQLAFMRSFADEYRYDVLYYGTKYIPMFVEHGYEAEAYDTDWGVFYCPSGREVLEADEYGNPYAIHAFWRTTEESIAKADTTGKFYPNSVLDNIIYQADKTRRFRAESEANEN